MWVALDLQTAIVTVNYATLFADVEGTTLR